MFDRQDAQRLAQAVYRKQRYEARGSKLEHVPTLDALLRAGFKKDDPFISKNPHVQYLGTRSLLPPAFLRRMVRIFGEPVVIESLRRCEPGWGEAVFVGICRNVERSAA